MSDDWTPQRYGDMERWIEMAPAHDKRHAEDNKNYGIHGVDMRFYLRGPNGAVQFVLFTNWQLPHVTQELAIRQVSEIEAGGSEFLKPVELLRLFSDPLPADLGYHAYEPHYDGHERMGPCDVLPDALGGCYYDGSTLNAREVYDQLLEKGSDGVWSALEIKYKEIFGQEVIFSSKEKVPVKAKLTIEAGLLMRKGAANVIRAYCDIHDITYNLKEYKYLLSSTFLLTVEGRRSKILGMKDWLTAFVGQFEENN